MRDSAVCFEVCVNADVFSGMVDVSLGWKTSTSRPDGQEELISTLHAGSISTLCADPGFVNEGASGA